MYPQLKKTFHLLDMVGINVEDINSNLQWADESPTCSSQKMP